MRVSVIALLCLAMVSCEEPVERSAPKPVRTPQDLNERVAQDRARAKGEIASTRESVDGVASDLQPSRTAGSTAAQNSGENE